MEYQKIFEIAKSVKPTITDKNLRYYCAMCEADEVKDMGTKEIAYYLMRGKPIPATSFSCQEDVQEYITDMLESNFGSKEIMEENPEQVEQFLKNAFAEFFLDLNV